MTSFAGLHVLADDDPRWRWSPVEQARKALKGGASVIQLRAKQSGDRTILEWAREIRSLTRAHQALFVVNDRFDLALLSEADAVHLGQDDLPPQRIPASLRERLAVGRSTHTPEQAHLACEEEVDYIAYGPVFGTQSKHSTYSARGLETLREIVSIAGSRPVVAIGGIGKENLTALLETGARGAAVISAVVDARDPEQAARTLATNPAWQLA